MITRVAKRILDILGSSVGLIVSLPIMLVVAVLVKLDSRGPVFYTQQRVGLNHRKNGRRYHQKVGADSRRSGDRRIKNLYGRPFQMIKFRTMVNDAEGSSGPVWATKGDPRVTRLGRLLRRSRIDEIPQFFNVLLGDMSLVGPRPERPSFVEELSGQVDNYQQRLQVKPGITGLAQVETGYDSSLDSVQEKVRLDLAYINSISFWTDLKILARTVIVVITGRGAC
ncbi:MAG: sugar transferase [candidate division Zixibacteria bacterium]